MSNFSLNRFLILTLHTPDDILLPITSTPHGGDLTARKARSALSAKSVKVNVHDGLALRPITISPLDSLSDILEKTSTAMRRPRHTVEIGYEACWSSKVGNKRNSAYISTSAELSDFWAAFHRYVKDQQSKKGNSGKDVECAILFRNMLDNSTMPVSTLHRN